MSTVKLNIALGALLLVSAVTAVVINQSEDNFEQNPLVLNSSDPEILRRLRGLRQDVSNSGCNVNVCFAIQGDDFVSSIDFFDQVNFVDLIATILNTDSKGGLCAVQYGRLTTAISPLTDNRDLFAKRLDSTAQTGGMDSNIAAALGYAAVQLRPRLEDANKIVIFTNGFESVGLAPKLISERIRKDGIRMCGVGVGDFSRPKLQEITGDDHRVLEINEYFELLEIVEDLVFDICGL